MKKFLYGTSLLVLYTSLANAQAPDTLWTRKYGDIYNEGGESVLQTSDDGYIIAGVIQSFYPDEGMYLIKTDSLGNILWEKIYNEAYFSAANSINTTMDGGYIIVGETQYVPNGPWDVYLIKVDSMGDREWTRMYGGLDYDDEGYHVVQTADGGYILGGYTYSFGAGGADAYVIRTDSIGDTLWTKTYGGSGREVGCWFQKTFDDGYIITGEIGPLLGSDIFLLKIDSFGDTVWVKTYGGAGNDATMHAEPTADQGYIIGGTTDSYGAGSYDIWLIKTDSLGDTLWTRTYGSPAREICYSVKPTQDRGYIVAGWSRNNSQYSIYLIKTDSLGNTLWTKTITGENNNYAMEVQQTNDLGYIVTGYYQYINTYFDVYLVRIAPDTLGIKEQQKKPVTHDYLCSTIFSGPLLLPESKNCRVFDITGRIMIPEKIKPGIYFIEVDGQVTQKVIKVN